MESEETVDAATGQNASQKTGKRKRKRLEVDEDDLGTGGEEGALESGPKRKVYRCLQVCVIWKSLHSIADKKVEKQTESISVLCQGCYLQVGLIVVINHNVLG